MGVTDSKLLRDGVGALHSFSNLLRVSGCSFFFGISSVKVQKASVCQRES
jgi:hypothetical protein